MCVCVCVCVFVCVRARARVRVCVTSGISREGAGRSATESWCREGSNGVAVMIVNYEHAYTQWANVTFDESAREIDSVSGLPVAVEDDAPDIEGLQLLFAPGAGRLFTFK